MFTGFPSKMGESIFAVVNATLFFESMHFSHVFQPSIPWTEGDRPPLAVLGAECNWHILIYLQELSYMDPQPVGCITNDCGHKYK